MITSLGVGQAEKHRVSFYWDLLFGRVKISVDGVPVLRTWKWFDWGLKSNYSLNVGTGEQHEVRIELKRPNSLARYRPWEYRFFVDGELVKTHTGT